MNFPFRKHRKDHRQGRERSEDFQTGKGVGFSLWWQSRGVAWGGGKLSSLKLTYSYLKLTVRTWTWSIPKGNEYYNHPFSGAFDVSFREGSRPSKNNGLEDEFPFGARSVFRGKLAVSFREASGASSVRDVASWGFEFYFLVSKNLKTLLLNSQMDMFHEKFGFQFMAKKSQILLCFCSPTIVLMMQQSRG